MRCKQLLIWESSWHPLSQFTLCQNRALAKFHVEVEHHFLILMDNLCRRCSGATAGTFPWTVLCVGLCW